MLNMAGKAMDSGFKAAEPKGKTKKKKDGSLWVSNLVPPFKPSRLQ